MNNEEKILMIEIILEDIRGNWGWEKCDRKSKAYELSEQLYESTHNEDWKELCACIANYYYGDDGRYFRNEFPNGYGGMEKLYSITNTFKDKSPEFKAIVQDYITYPEYRFDDWEENK